MAGFTERNAVVKIATGIASAVTAIGGIAQLIEFLVRMWSVTPGSALTVMVFKLLWQLFFAILTILMLTPVGDVLFGVFKQYATPQSRGAAYFIFAATNLTDFISFVQLPPLYNPVTNYIHYIIFFVVWVAVGVASMILGKNEGE